MRSHLHGHIGLIGVDRPFSPWFFGPFNPTLGDPDLSNGHVIAFADATGAFPTHVHPIGDDADPFERLEDGPIPLELISDAVLAERIGLEIVCAWTSPLGNAEVWYRLLNVGRPMAAMSGTDGWVDFHRTPTAGTGRNYLRLGGEEVDADSVREAAVAGRGLVTTGPALVFEIGAGVRPGGVVPPGAQPWRAMLASTTDVEVLEIVINGSVAQRLDDVAAGQARHFEGSVQLPDGVWVAARAYASQRVDDAWPSMHAAPFAHASPVWIGAIGSADPGARGEAATDLIAAIDAASKRARDAYGEVATPRMQARFDQAREVLSGILEWTTSRRSEPMPTWMILTRVLTAWHRKRQPLTHATAPAPRTPHPSSSVERRATPPFATATSPPSSRSWPRVGQARPT